MLETDPTLAVCDFTNQMEQVARQIADYQQRWEQRMWLTKTLHEKYLYKVEHLTHIADGTLAIAGVLKQVLPAVGDMADLTVPILDDLEQIALYKDSAPQMLYDKWCREYKVVPPNKLLRFPALAA